jgi:PIN domain nuclease of toxin-antitoxin system
MAAVAADTQAIVWYLLESARLSANAFQALDTAISSGGGIYVSTISLVEVAYLAEKRKVMESVFHRLERAMSDEGQGVVAVPVHIEIAGRVRDVPRTAVPDMPDRIIAATALCLSVPLVTSDSRIRQADIDTVW